MFEKYLIPFVNSSQWKNCVGKPAWCSNESSNKHETKQWVKSCLTIYRTITVNCWREWAQWFRHFSCCVWWECDQRIGKSIHSFNLVWFNFFPPWLCNGQLWMISKMFSNAWTVPIKFFLFGLSFNRCSIN